MSPPVQLQGKVHFMVLASDGLWNVVQDDEVVNTVATLHNKGTLFAVLLACESCCIDRASLTGKTPDDIAKQLTFLCETTPMSDNVTVIVVFFDYDGNETGKGGDLA